jgi:2-polyprenyl-3-methyl-5-hydroxy-6-metoxy-1,4-benzoquinol methylase
MFRMPKNSPGEDHAFYEREYEQGFTTELPDAPTLEQLKRSSFAPIGKDYSGYVQVLRAAGIRPGSSVYDFGASWGYGSWQLAQAGYTVYSYEISRARARYAEDRLGCHMLAEPAGVPRPVDCFFASHVLEHLAQPCTLWQIAADVLRPDGLVALFMPNGELARERRDPHAFHQLWGRVHPLLLTSRSVTWMAHRHHFDALGYSNPYELDRISAGGSGQLEGDELLVVARPAPVDP